MKKVISLILAISLIFGCFLALTACGTPEDEGAQIAVYLGEPIYDFDPTEYYANANAEQFMTLIYEPLFTLDENGKLGYGVAKDYSINRAERTVTVDLRETYWSDGVRVKGEDFLYAWRNILLEPTSATTAAPLLYDIENAIAVNRGELSSFELGVEASPDQLVITYREGADVDRLLKNLAAVATSPIRQDAKAATPEYWSKSANTIITNGPFTLAMINYENGVISVERNLGYHQNPDKRDFDNVVIPHKLTSFFTVDGYTVDATYNQLSHDVVFLMGNASLKDRAENKSNAKVYDDFSVYSYVFNTNLPVFANATVRKALSLAVNRAQIVNAITFAKSADGFLPDVSKGGVTHSSALISADAMMQQAQNLLATVDFTGIDKSFTITVNDDEESRKIAELVSANWAQLGFDVDVEYVGYVVSTVKDFATNTDIEIYDSKIQTLVIEAAKGDVKFDVIGLDWHTYSADPFVALSSFTSDMNGNGAHFDNSVVVNNKNISGWTNAQYDEYIMNAYNADSTAVRDENLALAEALLIEESPIVPIVFNQNFAFVNSALSNVNIDGYGHFVFTKVKQENYKDYLPEE